MQIEVKSCGECPFIRNEETQSFCYLMPFIDAHLHIDKPHENCPLKKESVTVKLKEE